MMRTAIDKTIGGITALKKSVNVLKITLCQFPMKELVATDVLCNKPSCRISCIYSRFL